MIGKVMSFNPFNGTPRHPDDIKSDPAGILVWDGEEPLRAASRVTGLVLTYTIDTGHINSLMLDSMRDAIKAAAHAHHTDILMRINGTDRTWQAAPRNCGRSICKTLSSTRPTRKRGCSCWLNTGSGEP